MSRAEQQQPLIITRQPIDRRGCRFLPVRRKTKQEWLNRAYTGIEALKKIGTREDLERLKEIYRDDVIKTSSDVSVVSEHLDNIHTFGRTAELHIYPHAPRALARELEYTNSLGDIVNLDYGDDLALYSDEEKNRSRANAIQGNRYHRVIQETIVVLSERFPQVSS